MAHSSWDILYTCVMPQQEFCWRKWGNPPPPNAYLVKPVSGSNFGWGYSRIRSGSGSYSTSECSQLNFCSALTLRIYVTVNCFAILLIIWIKIIVNFTSNLRWANFVVRFLFYLYSQHQRSFGLTQLSLIQIMDLTFLWVIFLSE
jgi:hypothetical protein